MAASSHRDKKSRFILFGLFFVFIIPMVLAWIFFQYQFSFGEKPLNHGQLFTKPLSLHAFNLYDINGKLLKQTEHNKWMLILFYPSQCNKTCQKQLFYLRQLRRAMGKDQNRVQSAILIDSNQAKKRFVTLINKKYQKIQLIRIHATRFQSLMDKTIPLAKPLASGTTFIVDPLGNFVMSFQPNTKPIMIYEDLKRLLKISQIG